MTVDESLGEGTPETPSSLDSDVAAYGIDIGRLREVENMFHLKKEKQKLSEKERATRKELMGARCLFEMDQFVKLSEVRMIMKEALMAIVDKVGKADDLARANAGSLSRLEAKVKALQTGMAVVKKVENSQELLFKWKNE